MNNLIEIIPSKFFSRTNYSFVGSNWETGSKEVKVSKDNNVVSLMSGGYPIAYLLKDDSLIINLEWHDTNMARKILNKVLLAYSSIITLKHNKLLLNGKLWDGNIIEVLKDGNTLKVYKNKREILKKSNLKK